MEQRTLTVKQTNNPIKGYILLGTFINVKIKRYIENALPLDKNKNKTKKTQNNALFSFTYYRCVSSCMQMFKLHLRFHL